MIIHCYSCGKRISDKMRVCPHCDASLADLGPEEQTELRRRRFRRRLHRARKVTQLAMGAVVIALLWWWLGGEPMVLDLPAPVIPMLLGVVGMFAYFIGWGWLLHLRSEYRRSR